MNEECDMGPSSQVRRGELQEVSDEEETGRPRYENPTGKTSETTELLFINFAEQKLWKQLLGLLSPSLWEVKVSEAPQSNLPAISLTGCPEVVSRAKSAISKLLIFVGCQIQINHMDFPHLKVVGFFQLQKGFHLFIWEGEASHIRADAVVRIGTSGGLDGGNAVLAQRVWSPEGSLHTNLDIHFSCPPTGELAAGMIKLALEAAWRKGFQSVIVTYLGPTISTAEAEVIVLGMEAFRKNHTVCPLKSLHVVSGDKLAAKLLYKEGQKHWCSGKDDSEKLRNMLLSLESTKIEVVTNPDIMTKVDVVVLPLALHPDGLGWDSGVHAITQKALETVPQCRDLSPGDILLVPGSTFPELDCRMIYLVRLDDLQLKPEEVHKIEEALSFVAEPVGLCRTEEPLFLQYLEENSNAFSEFQVQLKKAGYDIQIDLDRKLLVFQAINQSVQLLGLEKSFEFVRKKYVVHHETRAEILKVLLDHLRLKNRCESLRSYIHDQIWLVGLSDEINCLLQYLTHEAFQRELVSWECTAEPMLWYTIAKDVVLQEFLPSNPMIKLEIIAKTPATIRFGGSRKTVKEVERRLKELLNSFQVLPVPFSDFQLQFFTAHWGKVFYNHFFLQRSIPVVLELSQVVQIGGLDLGKMKEAKEILMKLVCERAMEIAEDLKWATEVSEWKLLLLRLSLETHKEVAIHHAAPGWVILVGFCSKVIQVEESIKKYLRENSLVEEKVKLARPELALAGNRLLHIIGWEHLRMNVSLQLKSQPSVLQVKGLQKYVKKAMPVIKRDLDSLVLDIIHLRKRILREYIFGIGVGLLKNMAWQLGCIAGVKTEESDDWKNIMEEVSMEERCATGFSGVIYVIGKRNPTNLLKQIVADLFAQFYTKTICHEAIATFKNMNIDEFLRNISHRLPVDIRWLQDNEIQIYGFQKDVENVLEAIHGKIEKYQSEIIEVQAQYESVPYTVISLFQKVFPTNPLVSIEDLANDSITIIFRGPRQKLVEVKGHFEEFLRSFQSLPISLSELQLQFVKAQWGKLFHNGFFWERNIPAVLEISEIVQVGGLSVGEIKEAEKILMEEVYEKYQSEIIEVKAQYESVPSTVIKESLFQKKFPTSPLVSTEVLANDPATILFRGPRQKLVELMGHFEELLRGFQFLPVCLSKLQLQFVKAEWGKLFHNDFFWERNIPAILEISEIVQIGGLSVGEIKEAEKILMEEVYEKYQSEIIEVKAQYESVPSTVIKESLFQKKFPTSPLVSTEVLANDPATILFRGPRQKLVELKGHFEELLRGFQFLPVCLSKLQLQFVKAQWGKLFHNGFFWERNIPAILEISEIVQIGGLSVGEIKEAEKILMEEVYEKYQSEIIEVKAQYESVPSTVIKESLFQKKFPTSPLVSTEVLANDPATILFRGPRQKLVELKGHFEELLRGFQFLPVCLSKLQLQFVKAQWGKLFHNGCFWERNIPAILEISEIVQIGGLSVGEIKKAENILMKQVCEKTVEIADQLQWVTKEPEWEDLLNRLKSHKEVAIHVTSSNQVAVVGPSLQTAVVENYIEEYLRDNSPLKESMMLTKPELVLAGESVLHIMNWEHLKVNIKFKPGNHILSLKVKGLQKFVKKAIPVIKKDLDSLVFDKIPLKKKALCIYFSEDGADLLKNMADIQNCIVRMQTQESHRSSKDGVLQGLAEDDRAVIFVVGIQSKVTSLKQRLSDFIAKFYKETICSAEISTFGKDGLKALCKTVPHQYPVGFHHLGEKMVWICGSQEDVEDISRKIYTKLEEVLTIKVQKAQAEQSVSKLLYETIRWHHRSDAGWSTFDMLTNRYLEEAYRKKKTEELVPWNGQKLKINFLTDEAFIPGQQKFKIRRDICLWDKNIAPFWETMDECLIKKVELQMYSREYQDVVNNFNKTARKYKVVKVERIQNRYLWVSYCWKKSWMEKKNPETTQNELILYHGTQPDKCSSICDIGFKSAFRKQCLFGKGIYFSVIAAHSVFYTKPDPQGLRYIFQARVLTGEYSCGKENMVLPPMKQDGNGLYDSLVDFLMNPNIFVIFFDDHAYPEYLITFCD